MITLNMDELKFDDRGLIPAIVGSVMHNLGAFAVMINSSRILRMNRDE